MPNPYPPRSRVECVGPNCHLIIAAVTAAKEQWKCVTKRKYSRRDQPEYIGWCRACCDKYGVEEPKR